jgi:hypothetical protein
MGIAIRLGYQLGLHTPRTGPLPVDKHQARLIIDSERTWIVLSCEYLVSPSFRQLTNAGLDRSYVQHREEELSPDTLISSRSLKLSDLNMWEM